MSIFLYSVPSVVKINGPKPKQILGEDTVGSQPKVKGVKVKTLGPVDVKIIRSKPSILGSKIGRNLRIMVQIGRNLVGIL